ncbi:MAG: FMN-dependent NADH-azoreductase [Psychromonas sp.]
MLNFIGISDVEVVYAESLAMGPETAELNIEQARKQLSVFA